MVKQASAKKKERSMIMNKNRMMKKIRTTSEELKGLLDIFGIFDFELQWKEDCYILQTYFETQTGQKINIHFVISDEGAWLEVWGDNCGFTFEQLVEKANEAFDFLVAVEELGESMFCLRTPIGWEVLGEQPLITVFCMHRMVDVMLDVEYEMA